MGGALTGAANRTFAVRGAGGISRAAASTPQTQGAPASAAIRAAPSTDTPVDAPTTLLDGAPTDMPMTLVADWKNPARSRTRSGAKAEVPPIPLWGYDDPTPDWVSPTRAMAQDWADRYGVNTAQLVRVGGECTRYGLLELGGHRFLVGPTAAPAEARALTRMLKTHPQIGAIFCVEPGAMQAQGESGGAAGGPGGKEGKGVQGYRERPISAYFSMVVRRNAGRWDAISATNARDAANTANTANAANAANAVAATDSTTPPTRSPSASGGPLDGGLSHVQFMEFEGMERFDTQIDGATLWRAGKGVADFMRSHPGKIALVCSEHGIARPCAVIASAALQLRDGDARLRSQLATEAVRQRAEASDHHINVASRALDLVAELSRLTAMLRMPGRGDPRWERKVMLLRQRLPELSPGAGVDWQGRDGRRQLAGVLEANFDRVAPLLASGGLPPGTALLWFRHEIDVLSGVRFLSPGYVGTHIDRISQDDIDPQSPDAVRLVSIDDYGLTCDNKYYDVDSVARWFQQCERHGTFMTNPVSRSTVVALLVKDTEKARLAKVFRR
ncbi:hypothetical protein UC34_18050 [Pandoraea vervacti]|uniref:Uncharacterized protein n=2 Tax=Pandoraea vervacti TaxID=656178 RepID=A0ABM5T0P5_9BURK|nr:hypothetical protein UC34_18050 [Pandoraea vervacti]